MFLRDFQRTTWHYIPDDSTLHDHNSENLESYKILEVSGWLLLWKVANESCKQMLLPVIQYRSFVISYVSHHRSVWYRDRIILKMTSKVQLGEFLRAVGQYLERIQDTLKERLFTSHPAT
jgi:hypothetical protein